MTYLWGLLAAAVVALMAYLMGRSGAKMSGAAKDAHDKAKASRGRLQDGLARKDDAAVQRDAMEGVKPLKPGRK